MGDLLFILAVVFLGGAILAGAYEIFVRITTKGKR